MCTLIERSSALGPQWTGPQADGTGRGKARRRHRESTADGAAGHREAKGAAGAYGHRYVSFGLGRVGLGARLASVGFGGASRSGLMSMNASKLI